MDPELGSAQQNERLSLRSPGATISPGPYLGCPLTIPSGNLKTLVYGFPKNLDEKCEYFNNVPYMGARAYSIDTYRVI
jgi:hypothetical protein